MRKLILGEEHQEAGKVLYLYRGPRSVEVFDDGLEFASLEWDTKYEKWEVRQGTLEPMPGGQLYLTDDLAEAFCVLRDYLADIHPYKPVRPSLKALRGPRTSPG